MQAARVADQCGAPAGAFLGPRGEEYIGKMTLVIAAARRGCRREQHRMLPGGESASPEAGLWNLVAKGGIEPPTQGFSILCSTD